MKKMTLNNIHEWPLMTRALLLGLVFSAAFYVGYRYDLANQSQVLSRAEQKEADLRQQIELVIRKSKIVEEEVVILPKMKAELAKWDKQISPASNVPQILNDILKIGADNHLFFSLFAPSEANIVKLQPRDAEKPAENASASPTAQPAAPAPANAQPAAEADKSSKAVSYAKMPIKVVVVGTYHQIADFISQVANMPAIVVIGDFTISNENQNSLLGEKMAKQADAQHLLTGEMTLNVYHLPESK
jgi:type IV pilus assembly protein PilO